MRAKFGSILDASVTDENCEFRFCPIGKLRNRIGLSVIPAERKDSTDGLVQMVVYEHVEALRQLGRTLDQTLQAGAMLRDNKRMVG